jgi:3-phosphoshikimate 1-carboxyvinyltransferase
MKLTVKPSVLKGEIAVSGSKSHTIRGIVAALAGTGKSLLRSPLGSADTLAVLDAAKLLGAQVMCGADFWEITGTGGRFTDPGQVIDMKNSGTGLRLLSGMCALQDFTVSFDGDSSLRTRKMATLLDSFAQLGAKIDAPTGKCPFSMRGPVTGGPVTADGSSSQFLSALLLSLPLAAQDSVITLDFLNEQPYVGITTSWMDALGLHYRRSDDLLRWEIPGRQKISSFDRTIPADFSTAAFPLVAGMIAGGGVGIRNLDFSDPQGDKAVFDFAEKMGARLERGEFLHVLPGSRLHGCDLDLNATPDALPVLAVAGAFARGTTRLLNVPQARIKETDRIAVMAQELPKIGIAAEELPDGLVIHGGKVRGGRVSSHGDHRVAMAFAVAGLAAQEPIEIEDAECAGVSYPRFFDDFTALGADFIRE